MAPDGTRARTLPAARPAGLGAWATPARRAAMADALWALVLSRLVIWWAGTGAVAVWGLSGRTRDFDPSRLTRPFGGLGDALVAPAARWDSTWFLTLADHGYVVAGHVDVARPAFFPLYPLLARVAGAPLGSSLLGGLVVSLVCSGVALYLLHRLTALELGPEAARGAVWALALFPMSFFLSAVYSEGLFLMLSVGAVYAARTDRWAWAGALGALGAGTRSAGVLLVVPLALLAWRARGRPGGLALRLAWTALVPAGLAAFCLYLALRGGSWRAPFDAQQVWYRAFAWPFAGVRDGTVAAWDGARQLLSGSRTPVYYTRAGGDPFNAAWRNLQGLAFLVLVVPAVAGVLRRLPVAYGAYLLAGLALALSYPVAPQPLMSLPRFELVLFPAAMWAGWWATRPAHPWRARVLAAAGAVSLAAFGAQFATWHWVA